VADTRTAFLFEATTWIETLITFGNDISYRFYTPNSNEFDVTVLGAGYNEPVSDSLTGFLKPGVTYRLEFTAQGNAAAPPSSPRSYWGSSSGTARLSFPVIPEPTPIALLVIGLAISSFPRKCAERAHPRECKVERFDAFAFEGFPESAAEQADVDDSLRRAHAAEGASAELRLGE
jgi:hypothetical protein